MKTNDYHLDFLRAKIEEAGTALCTLHHPAFWVSTHIIHTIKVDEDGNIWFKIMQHSSQVAVDLHTFSVSLSYYKKQLGFNLKIQALATATEDDGVLFIKAKIMTAEYFEDHNQATHKPGGMMQQFRKRFMQMASSFF